MKILCYILCLFFGLVYSKSNIGTRIIGGQLARAGQFPYVAGIYAKTLQGQYFCGGVLISQLHVLTAAHCVEGAREFTIRLGTNKLGDPDKNGAGETVATSDYVMHPKYDNLTLEHDIAIIHTRMTIYYGEYCHPVVFSRPKVVEGLTATVTGWGQLTDADEGLTEYLYYVDVVVITQEECQMTYGDQIKETMICTQGNYDEGICVGDTGGPLVHVNENHSVLLIAIASFFSQVGCQTIHPSGYLRTDVYLDWILEVTNNTIVLEPL